MPCSDRTKTLQVKLEFLRMLLRMELDPARMTLLTGFFETYLKLNEEEENQLEIEMGKIDVKEAKRMMEITTSWERKGRAEGKVEGQANILVRQLKKKFGNIPVEVEDRVRNLSVEKQQELAEAIFDLKSIDDIKAFL
jgi:hypothetical protein